MELNVIKNTKRNLVFGVINKIVALLCPFVLRTIILAVLGSEYLGLNSLFSSILTVLSLSELGFGTAIVYNMYKPVADNDVDTICALLNFYRKVYAIIGVVILAIGLMLIPFLPNFISGSYPDDIILVIPYLLYLFNTIISYFMFAYMSSLIVVYQRDDINSRTNTLVTLLLYGSQITVLLTTHNYYLFLVLMPIFTIVNNLRIAYVVRKMFPQIRPRGSISSEIKADIKVRVSGAFISKVCQVTRNSLDSICISTFMGLAMTGMYNNYYYIMSAIIILMGLVATAIQGGVGNHVASRTVEDNYKELKELDFVYMWVATWCTVCLLCMFQPFMEIWMGADMMFPFPVVILLCLYFYMLKMGDMRGIYSSANGLWWQHRYRSIVETIGNVALNVILGYRFGVYGIISATIITIICCNFFWGAHITFKNYFGLNFLSKYIIYQLKYFVIMAILSIITYAICTILPFENVYLVLIIRAVICVVIPNLIWILIFHGADEFSYAVSIIKKRG